MSKSNKNNNPLPSGNFNSDIENLNGTTTKSIGLPENAKLVVRHISILDKFKIDGPEHLFTILSSQLKDAKEAFLKNDESKDGCILRTNHNLPKTMLNVKSEMYDFLTSFIFGMKENGAVDKSVKLAIVKLSPSSAYDLLSPLSQINLLYRELEYIESLYHCTLLCDQELVQKIKCAVNNDSEFHLKSKLESLKFIEDLIPASKSDNLDTLLKIDLLRAVLNTLFYQKNHPRFLEVSIEYKGKTYKLTEKIVTSYKYLHDNQDRTYTLEDLRAKFSLNKKDGIKSLFGDVDREDSDTKSAFQNLLHPNPPYRWKS